MRTKLLLAVVVMLIGCNHAENISNKIQHKDSAINTPTRTLTVEQARAKIDSGRNGYNVGRFPKHRYADIKLNDSTFQPILRIIMSISKFKHLDEKNDYYMMSTYDSTFNIYSVAQKVDSHDGNFSTMVNSWHYEPDTRKLYRGLEYEEAQEIKYDTTRFKVKWQVAKR